MKLMDTSECKYCQNQDFTGHTILSCPIWIIERTGPANIINLNLNKDNIVREIIYGS